MPNILIALFLVAHGIVHPILVYHPSRDSAEIVGGLWKKSWLLGEGITTKRLIWIGSAVTCLLFALASLSLMGWILPQEWWRVLLIAASAASLLTLVLFWFTEFIFGVFIDVALLVANWNPMFVG